MRPTTLPAGAENAFWFNLVELEVRAAWRTSPTRWARRPRPLLHDWATSVFLDDNAPNVDPRYQQPSWNIRSVLTGGGVSTAFPLLTHILIGQRAGQPEHGRIRRVVLALFGG